MLSGKRLNVYYGETSWYSFCGAGRTKFRFSCLTWSLWRCTILPWVGAKAVVELQPLLCITRYTHISTGPCRFCILWQTDDCIALFWTNPWNTNNKKVTRWPSWVREWLCQIFSSLRQEKSSRSLRPRRSRTACTYPAKLLTVCGPRRCSISWRRMARTRVTLEFSTCDIGIHGCRWMCRGRLSWISWQTPRATRCVWSIQTFLQATKFFETSKFRSRTAISVGSTAVSEALFLICVYSGFPFWISRYAPSLRLFVKKNFLGSRTAPSAGIKTLIHVKQTKNVI